MGRNKGSGIIVTGVWFESTPNLNKDVKKIIYVLCQADGIIGEVEGFQLVPICIQRQWIEFVSVQCYKALQI